MVSPYLFQRDMSDVTPELLDPDAPKKNLPLKKMNVILNRCYDKSMNTKNIIGDFGFIPFTKEFKYLGSIVSSDLDDYTDISFRIKKASQPGVLNFFWDSDHVDISANLHMYLAIPIHLLLRGCQTWAITKILTQKLEVSFI